MISPSQKKFGANCAPSEDNASINLNILFEFQLAARKPRSADKLEEFAEHKPRPAGKLIVLAERKPRPADKIEFAERKSRSAGNVKFAERKPRPAGNSFEEFAERKPRPADKLMVFAECKPRTQRPAGKLYWELLVVAIGCYAKDSSSDFLPWHSPRWELSVAAIGCFAKDSSSDFSP